MPVTSCRDCITACHNAHNVPDIGNPKEEVKWIWPERFENVFPAENHAYIPEAIRKQIRAGPLQPLRQPALRAGLPHGGHLQEGGRHRDDGLPPLHRVQICMAACPYGARSMNFRNPRPFIPKINPDFPTRTKGVVEKCNFCEERLAQGILPACVMACKEKALVFGDVDDPRSRVRQLLDRKFSIRRRAELGTKPQVYYIL